MTDTLVAPHHDKIYTGVLFLHQQFGRHKNKLLYRCVPTDKHLPVCLIPYQIAIGFFKKPVHKYILFQYLVENVVEGESNHILGRIHSVLGPVDDLTAYYDYLLHFKNIFYNNAWQRNPMSFYISHDIPHFEMPWEASGKVEDVFTIDSKDTVDFDDALQYEYLEEGRVFRVSVYITCVAAYLVQLFPPSSSVSTSSTSDDWIYIHRHFTSNASTVYLPHRRIPMLLDVISKNVTLSASQKEPVVCLCIRFSYEAESLKLLHTEIGLTKVRVCFNWTWTRDDAGPLHAFTQKLIQRSGCPVSNAYSSKDTVAYWMIQYNQYVAHFCQTRRIFAWHRQNPGFLNAVASPELLHGENLHIHGTCSENQYRIGQLGQIAADYLVPATNPMRRLVDLFNQFCLLFYQSTERNTKLLNYFEQMADSLNAQLKSISKVQRNCRLLNTFQGVGDPTKTYPGVLFHRIFDSVGKRFHYSVFFRELGVFLPMKSAQKLDEGVHLFRLFYFKDALETKQKISVTIA